jgi:hypothetical protein
MVVVSYQRHRPTACQVAGRPDKFQISAIKDKSPSSIRLMESETCRRLEDAGRPWTFMTSQGAARCHALVAALPIRAIRAIVSLTFWNPRCFKIMREMSNRSSVIW